MVVKTKDGYRKYIAPKDSDFDEPYKQGYVKAMYMIYPDKKALKKHLAKLIKIRSKLDSNQKYQYHPIKEVSNTGADGIQGVDSGPSLMFKNVDHYKGRGNQEAEKLGWSVLDYIIKNDADDLPPSSFEMLDGWPLGPHNSVSYLPAGIGTGKTPNNQENLTGTKGYDKWVRAMRTKAQEVGYELMKFTKQDRDTRKQIAKDTVDTIKQQEKEEVEENVFTMDWWKSLLSEEDIMDKEIKYKDKEGNEKEATIGGILKQGEEHPAHKKAKQMVDKDKDKKSVKKTTIDANPFDKEEPKEKSKSKKELKQHNPKEWSEANFKEEAGEVKHNLPNQDLTNKSEDEIVDFLKNNSEDRQLSDDEVKYMSNTEAGLALKYMKDDTGESDEFGDTDKTEKVKNLINYQNFAGGNETPPRWEYTKKALAMFKEKGIEPPKYDDSDEDGAYDDPKNHKQFKIFKKIMNNPEMVEKKSGGEAGGKWRDIDGLVEAFEKGAEIPSNLVAQDKNGNTHLVGGNTRFVAAIAAGVNPTTKVIQVDKVDKIDNEYRKYLNESITEVSAKTKRFKQKLMRRGIVIRYDKAKALKDLMRNMVDKVRLLVKSLD